MLCYQWPPFRVALLLSGGHELTAMATTTGTGLRSVGREGVYAVGGVEGLSAAVLQRAVMDRQWAWLRSPDSELFIDLARLDPKAVRERVKRQRGYRER